MFVTFGGSNWAAFLPPCSLADQAVSPASEPLALGAESSQGRAGAQCVGMSVCRQRSGVPFPNPRKEGQKGPPQTPGCLVRAGLTVPFVSYSPETLAGPGASAGLPSRRTGRLMSLHHVGLNKVRHFERRQSHRKSPRRHLLVRAVRFHLWAEGHRDAD